MLQLLSSRLQPLLRKVHVSAMARECQVRFICKTRGPRRGEIRLTAYVLLAWVCEVVVKIAVRRPLEFDFKHPSMIKSTPKAAHFCIAITLAWVSIWDFINQSIQIRSFPRYACHRRHRSFQTPVCIALSGRTTDKESCELQCHFEL